MNLTKEKRKKIWEYIKEMWLHESSLMPNQTNGICSIIYRYISIHNSNLELEEYDTGDELMSDIIRSELRTELEHEFKEQARGRSYLFHYWFAERTGKTRELFPNYKDDLAYLERLAALDHMIAINS